MHASITGRTGAAQVSIGQTGAFALKPGPGTPMFTAAHIYGTANHGRIASIGKLEIKNQEPISRSRPPRLPKPTTPSDATAGATCSATRFKNSCMSIVPRIASGTSK